MRCVCFDATAIAMYVRTCVHPHLSSFFDSLSNLFLQSFLLTIQHDNHPIRYHSFRWILFKSWIFLYSYIPSFHSFSCFIQSPFLNFQQSHHFPPHFLTSFLFNLTSFFVHFHKLCVCALFVDFNDFVIAKCQTVKNTEILVSILVEYFSIHS